MWLLAVLVAAPPLAHAGNPSLEFGAGATVVGTKLTWNADWIAMVFGPSAIFQMGGEFPSGFREQTYQVYEVSAQATPGAGGQHDGQWEDGVATDAESTLAWRKESTWAVVFLTARSLTVNLTSGALTILPDDLGCPNDWMRRSDQAANWLPAGTCVGDGAGVVVRQLEFDEKPVVDVSLDGGSQLIVQNLTVDCPQQDSCPSGGHRTNHRVPPNPHVTGAVQDRSFAKLTSPAGHLRLTGSPEFVILGGTRLNATFSGSVRLPLAGAGACDLFSACALDDEQTLRLWGDLTFSDLQSSSEGRLHAEVSGDIAAARLDNAPLAVETGVVAVAVGATVLALLAKVALGALSTRHLDNPLGQPNRRKLHDFILAHPGATFREVVRGTEIPTGTARHHLAVLLRENLIQEHGHHATLRYFENHGRFDDSWNTVVLLREPELNKLHHWLLDHPGVIQREILESIGYEWGWSRSTTQHRLARLAAEGLVDIKLQGRMKRYTARRRAPVPV